MLKITSYPFLFIDPAVCKLPIFLLRNFYCMATECIPVLQIVYTYKIYNLQIGNKNINATKYSCLCMFLNIIKKYVVEISSKLKVNCIKKILVEIKGMQSGDKDQTFLLCLQPFSLYECMK